MLLLEQRFSTDWRGCCLLLLLNGPIDGGSEEA
jgi:hypothetical protein